MINKAMRSWQPPAGERLNTVTHLLGALLAFAGSLVLMNQAIATGGLAVIVSFAVFGAAMVLLYSASTAYHASRGAWKQWLRKLDHCAIYLMITGTYAPFMLVTLAGPLGWTLMGLVSVLCVLGLFIELRCVAATSSRKLSLLLYLGMGWLGIAAIGPLATALGPEGLFWLAAGGVAYTVGVLFYVLDDKFNWRHAHGVWHLFVLAGSASHYGVVLAFVR
jgi:hemolysin III